MFDHILQITCPQSTLNNFITNKLNISQSIYTLFLSPTGRYITDCYIIYIDTDDYLIHISNNHSDVLKKHILQYNIQNNIKIKDIVSQTTYGKKDIKANYSYKDIRHPKLKYFNIYLDIKPMVKDKIKILSKNNQYYITSLENYQEYLKHKYQYIIIDGSIELLPFKSLPYQYNLNHAISYTKGCYLGQETTMKLYTQSSIKFILSNSPKHTILSQYQDKYISIYKNTI